MTKNKNNLLVTLKTWLKKPGNSFARVAVILGYKDSAPIRQWIARGKIPSYQQDRVKQLINGELK